MAEPDDLLSQEYMLLQNRIEEFDARLLTIKAWSVTFSAAAIGLSWEQNNPRLLLVAAISAFAFWMGETVVKTHQRCHYPRLAEIEAHFAGTKPTDPLQISTSWHASFEKEPPIGRFLKHAAYPNVCLPHILIIAAALGFFVAGA